MSLPVILRPEARAEYDAAFDWHEAQQAGRGVTFARHVQEVFDRISANPKIHAVVHGDIRKSVVRKFPYCVFYRERSDHVEILAVFHTSRDPSIWQSRA